jgi:flavin reductase (DIM6/NTAB) family NADH-FMN oxidoreductase RutF
VTPEAFKAAMAELPAGVTVLTAWDREGRPVGATVSAVTSLSLNPPMLLACLATTSDTLQVLEPGSPFAVHVLRDGQQDVATSLAGKGADKFARVPWRKGPHDLPQLEGSAVVAACEVSALVPGGDHVVVLAHIRRVDVTEGTSPLVYHRRRMLAVDSLAQAHRHTTGATR